MASQMSLESFIRAIPKCELHVHLEGCLTPDLVKTLASRNNIPVPSPIASASNSSGYAFHDLATFLDVYIPAMSVLRTRQDFHDLAWDYFVRARNQNVRVAEMFFDPQAHVGRGVAFDIVLDGLWDAVVRAKQELGITAGLIMCILQDQSVESAMEVLELGLKESNRDRILGLGMDGDDRDNPPAKFEEVYARARREGGAKAGWKLTMHCFIDQPHTLMYVRQALMDIEVDRIDHGSNIVADTDLVKFVKDKRIGLTCCPISYSMLLTDFKGHEILALLKEGVKVTINSDDPAYFKAYVEENLLKMGKDTDISWKELIQLERNAFEIAWVDEQEKDVWLRELDRLEQDLLSV